MNSVGSGIQFLLTSVIIAACLPEEGWAKIMIIVRIKIKDKDHFMILLMV